MTERRAERANQRKSNSYWFWAIIGAYCRGCGYDTSINALHCHHLDRKQKAGTKDTLAVAMGQGRDVFEEWAAKTRFVILCANCHAELHAKLWAIPEEYPGDQILFCEEDKGNAKPTKGLLRKILGIAPYDPAKEAPIRRIRLKFLLGEGFHKPRIKQ